MKEYCVNCWADCQPPQPYSAKPDTSVQTNTPDLQHCELTILLTNRGKTQIPFPVFFG